MALSDYTDLLPSANADKPDFFAVLEAILSPFIDIQDTLQSLPQKYDVEEAVGAQLDVVGQWIGFGRQVLAPIEGVYLSLGIEGLGLGQGGWLRPGDPTEGLVSLDDPTYRLMLFAKIAANYWDGSRAQLQEIFATFFQVSPGTYSFVVDGFDMTMTLGLSGKIPGAIFQQLFLRTGVPFPPAAVLSKTVVTTVDEAPILGLGVDNNYIGGLGRGAWGASLT